MAQMEGEWSHQHREIINRIETELGREICGVPTSSGLPCKEWPISQTHGRCRRHSSGSSSPSPDPAKEQRPPAESPSGHSEPLELIGLSWGRITVVVAGILIGGLVGGGGFYMYPDAVARIARLSGTGPGHGTERPNRPRAPQTHPVSQPLPEVDPHNPNFRDIIRYYRRSGRAGPVLATLNTIIKQSSKPRDRAEAMYRKYVLLQMEEQFKECLAVADEFLSQFPNNPHRPEILYGAGWIASNFLDDSNLARSYFERLKDEFPESKWTQNLSSSRS